MRSFNNYLFLVCLNVKKNFSKKTSLVPAQDRQIGSIADYDPMNGNWGTAGGGGTGAANTKVKGSGFGFIICGFLYCLFKIIAYSVHRSVRTFIDTDY